MTLAQLQIFAAVATHGGVRAAARVLGMAQSGVTEQLRKLEASVGVSLFERSNRGVTPTPFGERLLIRATLIAGEFARAEQELRQLQGDFQGTIVLGMSTEPLIAVFPRVLSDFHVRYPRVSIHMMSGTSRAMVGGIRDGRLDFACAFVPDTADVAGLSLTRLFRSEPVVVCRSGHPLRHARSLAALADAQWIGTRQPDLKAPPVSRLTDLFEGAGLGKPEIVATTEALFDSLHLVAHTDYLALEPRAVTTHPFFERFLERIDIAETPRVADIFLVQRAGIPLPPAVQELASMLASYARLAKLN